MLHNARNIIFDGYRPSEVRKSSTSNVRASNSNKAKVDSKGTVQSKSPILLTASMSGRRDSNKSVSRRRASYFVSGTSHIVDPSVRKAPAHISHPLAKLDLAQDEIDILRPLVYGSQYSLNKDPNPFYAPWNPPKLRRAEDESSHTPERYGSEDSESSLIDKFRDAIDNPKEKPKICSMFDCSNIRFTFDNIHKPDDIGSVPLPDLQELEDAAAAEREKRSASSENNPAKKKVTLKSMAGKPLFAQIETVYKPLRKSKFLDSPHQMSFYVLKGKPILTAPLSFLGNTFMGSKKLLAPSADNPIYKKLGIHRYEVNMEGFRDEQITFEICEKKVSVMGRKKPSPRSSSLRERKVVEMFHLAPFLNMNRMRIYRGKTGRLIFEEKWKDEESSDEEANPLRRKMKKK